MPRPRRARRVNRKRRAMRKRAGVRRKYADTHSFKLQSMETTIVNANKSGVILPSATGVTFIGPGQTSPSSANRLYLSGSFGFTCNSALQWGQLRTLFDRVKVTGIKVRVIPQFNVAQANGSGSIPVMRMVYDYDDNSVPAINDVWSRRGIERRLNRPFSVFLKPKLLSPVSNGANTSVYAPVNNQYLNCSNADTVTLLGLKYAIKDWPCYQSNIVPASDQVLRFEVTYYMTFKNQIQVGRQLEFIETVPQALDDGPVACENEVLPSV